MHAWSHGNLPDDGRSEYLVQYTHAGQSIGCLADGLVLAWELSESELRHWSPFSPRGFRESWLGDAGFFAAVTVCGVEVPSVLPTGSVRGAAGL